MGKYLKVASLSFILGATLSFFVNFKEEKHVIALASGALPTTISLKDSTEQEIRNYYQGLNSLSDDELQGTNLLKNLKPILSNNQQMYSYDTNNGLAIWQLYEIIDRDWGLSPASAITKGTYDPVEDKITGYVYGKSASNPGDNPYVRALYVDRSKENPMKAWGNHTQNYGGINREHIWPKSHGFDQQLENSDGARGDPMHLWAADGYTNNIHNNYFYGYVDLTKDHVDCKDKIDYSVGNYRGVSKTLGSGTVFEPQDSDKGDIARSVFYMVARYNNYAGATSGIDANDPNLVLENGLTGNNATGTSTASEAYSLGILQDLLEWNKLDPVDEFEIHRNNLLFNNYTNNRNPFIDFPEWADYIWGTSTDGVYDDTPKGKASPLTDKINGSVNPLSISTTSISLFKVGETKTIKAIVDGHDDADIHWSVSDSEVISLSKTTTKSNEEVTITALKDGSATITASITVDETNYIKTCKVSVGEATPAPENRPLDMKMIIIIGAVVVVVIIILIIIFATASKKNKKKMLNKAKKIVKKSSSSSKKKSTKK